MKEFKTGCKKKAYIKKEEIKSKNLDIMIQSQLSDDIELSCCPPNYSLCWIIDYSKDKIVKSEWTPIKKPSITKTFESISDGISLTIIGKNIWTNCELELAKVKFDLIKGFGFIGERSFSKPDIEHIIGMWIELKDNRMIKVWVNGKVKEHLK